MERLEGLQRRHGVADGWPYAGEVDGTIVANNVSVVQVDNAISQRCC